MRYEGDGGGAETDAANPKRNHPTALPYCSAWRFLTTFFAIRSSALGGAGAGEGGAAGAGAGRAAPRGLRAPFVPGAAARAPFVPDAAARAPFVPGAAARARGFLGRAGARVAFVVVVAW
jgi:hypothetical protein